MRHTFKPISVALALAFLSGQTAFCQEAPSLPRLPSQEQAPGQPAPEAAPADTVSAKEPPPAAPAADTLGPAPLPAAADSAAPAAKPVKKKLAFKPGKIVLDRNGKIFLAATAVLLGTVYLSYRYFRKDVK